MTALAFILCVVSCRPIPDAPGDVQPPPGSTSLPPGEEMLEAAWMYGGHDLRGGPLVHEGPGYRTSTSLRPNWGLKTVSESDTDGDGVMDERFTTEELSDKKKRRMLEKRAGKDTPWVVAYDTVGPAYDLMREKSEKATPECLDGITQRFPRDLGPPLYGNPAVLIPYGGTSPNRCTAEQGAKLKAAFECVRRKTDACLAALNPGMRGQLRDVLDAPDTKAVVSCTGECFEGAQTKTLRGSGGIFQGIELPPGIVNASASMACEFLFHELLHVARVKMGQDHDTKGNDSLYACARVCSGCSHASVGAGDDHKDCAACGEPAPNKGICGFKPSVLDERLPDAPPTCADASIPPNFTAGERRKVAVLYCDGTPSNLQTGWCIERCPEGFSVAGTGAGGWCSGLRPPEESGSSCKASEPLWLCTV